MINPTIAHPYLSRMIQGEREGQSEVERFVRQHARPMWPCWLDIESKLTELLFGLFLTLDRTTQMTPLQFWNESCKRIANADAARTLVANSLDAMQRIARG